MCSICEITNQEPDLFSDDEIDRIVYGIYAGIITVRSLDLATYQKVARKLSEGVYKGFGAKLDDVLYLSDDYQMLRALRTNVYVFSGAKQYQQVREMSSLILDGDRIRPFSEYKKVATEVFKEYNVHHLNAEYNSAIAQSRSASQWMEIYNNRAILPYLTYKTVGDGRVRPEHAALNGITRKVTDPFWDRFMPPNGWNCRCDVSQYETGKETDLSNFKTPDSVPDIFQFNAGKEKIVFSKKHPYFKVAPQDKEFAKMNFGMPL